MYQKCPICLGTGINQSEIGWTDGLSTCPTCNGGRIINENTGKPPAIIDKGKSFKDHLKYNSEVVKDWPKWKLNCMPRW